MDFGIYSLNILLDIIAFTVCLFFLFILFHIFICRFFDVNKIYLFCILFFIFFAFASYKGILILHFFLFMTAFIVTYLEFFSLIKRGFSISLLSSLPIKNFSYSKLEKIYSGNKGLQWMLKKRIRDILYLRIIIIKNAKYKLSNSGKLIYLIIYLSVKIFNLKKIG